MRLPISILSLLVVFVGANSGAAEVKAKTLKCDINYSNTDGNDFKNEKLPVSVKTIRDIDAPRMNAKAKVKTADGRYEVSVNALQPLKGDITQFEQVGIEVTDTVTNTVTFPGDVGLTRAGHDVDHAAMSIMVNSDDNTKSLYLSVDCDLK